MSTSEIVAAWTPVIVRGAVFQKTFKITDEAGTPVPFTTAEIIITPKGDTPLSWTQGNGKFTLTSPGVYYLSLDEADTMGYAWSSGVYRLSVVDGSGDSNPCLIEGRIFVKDC
jgi:hypothetical protein